MQPIKISFFQENHKRVTAKVPQPTKRKPRKREFREKKKKSMRPDRGSTDNESRSVSAAIGRGVAELEAVLHKWVRRTSYELGFVVVRGSLLLWWLLRRWSGRKSWLKAPYLMCVRI